MEAIKEGFFYHIYNRGAGKSNLFWTVDDYREFIKKYVYYLYPSVQTFAWCLMSNHFHALIRIRTVDEQSELFRLLKNQFEIGNLHGNVDPAEKAFIASKQLSHFMNGYTRFINKKRERSGTLIEGPLKRKKIEDEKNFNHLVCYIHRNPIHHGVKKNYTDFKYSSYIDYLNNRKSFTEKTPVLQRFGGIDNFLKAHDEFKLNIDFGNDLYLE
jgi:REP element-mobilizing transposase RayT